MNELRYELQYNRDHLKDEQRSICALDICDALYKDITEFGSNTVLGFMPIGSEVDLNSLYYTLFDEGYELYFPVTVGKDMTFYKIEDLNDFQEGRYGILEPYERKTAFDINQRAYTITPGIVFDIRKFRLGYGGGFYDRFFKEAVNLFKVGVCFDMQVVDLIAENDWDVPVDKIITEKRVIL